MRVGNKLQYMKKADDAGGSQCDQGGSTEDVEAVDAEAAEAEADEAEDDETVRAAEAEAVGAEDDMSA